MEIFLSTLSFLQALICVTMKIKAERIFTGTEGGCVEIYCKYPDGYQYSPIYFCRHPCTYSDVIIKTGKADVAVSNGRYAALNTVSARSFSVTIRHLRLKDSGVYYCGVEKWGSDMLIKVNLTASKVPTVSTHTPLSRQRENTEATEFLSATTVITPAADNSTLYDQTSATQTQSLLDSQGQRLAVCGGVLGLILCCVLAAIVILYYKTSSNITSLKPAAPEIQTSHPPADQENICHVHDEMLAVYSLAGPAIGDESLATYSTIQIPAPADKDYNPYCLITPH